MLRYETPMLRLQTCEVQATRHFVESIPIPDMNLVCRRNWREDIFIAGIDVVKIKKIVIRKKSVRFILQRKFDIIV